jgi:hypothetical protein
MTIMEELGFALVIAVTAVGSLTVVVVMYQWGGICVAR